MWQMVEEATTVLDCVPLCIELKTPTVKLLSEMLTEATQQFIKADSDAMCTRTGGTLCHLLELVGYNAGWSSRSGLPLHPAAYDSKDPIIPAVLSLWLSLCLSLIGFSISLALLLGSGVGLALSLAGSACFGADSVAAAHCLLADEPSH